MANSYLRVPEGLPPGEEPKLHRPADIMVGDYGLWKFLKENLDGSGTSVTLVNEAMVVIKNPPNSRVATTPLIAISAGIFSDMNETIMISTGRLNRPPKTTTDDAKFHASTKTEGKFIVTDPNVPLTLYTCCNTKCGIVQPELMACGRCKVTRYCGQDCQRQDWKEHKANCKKK